MTAPAQVAERVASGVFERPLDLEQASRITNVVHWSYGTLWGIGFGIVQRSLGLPVVAAAVGFGTLVWASDYAVLPAMKIYKPAWRYPASTLAIDLGRHLAYGAGVAGAFALLERRAAPGRARLRGLTRLG
jgi:predicted branched-subunit amino acid permease